jgi:hypothetical protein
MGMMEGQARSSGLLMGFDNHLIARSCACPFIHPAHSPDYHQPDKPAQCRGPALTLERSRHAYSTPATPAPKQLAGGDL